VNILSGASVLVTGGTGSFGHRCISRLLALPVPPRRIVVYSRDEDKQRRMAARFASSRMRMFLGDVRDLQRLTIAMRGVDYVINAAALKQVPACEYNPTEAVATNVTGVENVIHAAMATGVKRVVQLSSDKASQPLNLYGATKLTGERLVCAANAYSPRGTAFLATRYGNVAGSRGSVVPVMREAGRAARDLVLFGPGATRFWMTQDQAVDLVFLALSHGEAGCVHVPRLRSFRVADLAAIIAADCGVSVEVAPPRAGDKTHEALIGADESAYTRRCGDHYRIGREIVSTEAWALMSNDAGCLMSRDELRAALGALGDASLMEGANAS
jgi:UDP-N-acetylglucosamine 4,6-dehydratase